MERIIINLQSEGEAPRRINVRRNLPVQGLLDEIRSRLDLRSAHVSLREKDAAEPLDPARTLAQCGLKDGVELILVSDTGPRLSRGRLLMEQGARLPLTEGHLAYLEEERNGVVFRLEWQPAIIGRAVQMDPSASRLLAVDLTGLTGAEYVSRQHACLTESAGQYSIEGLNPRNPTFVNEEELAEGAMRVLQPGDRVRVGKMVLTFNLRG